MGVQAQTGCRQEMNTSIIHGQGVPTRPVDHPMGNEERRRPRPAIQSFSPELKIVVNRCLRMTNLDLLIDTYLKSV